MQENYEAPVTGSVRFDLGTAQTIADFMLVLLKLPDSPLSMDQIKAFSEFREVVKKGPTNEVKLREGQTLLGDGIIMGSGPKCSIDRHTALSYLRGSIAGVNDPDLTKKMQLALLSAVASKGPKHNTGINGKYCAGVFGYTDPEEAKDYLSGKTSEILVKRGKNLRYVMPTYFDQGPNFYLGVERKEWVGKQGA